ncbi:MAG: SpoVG family protein [Gemmatales bacterium]|nr:SpoVG family protein [Gemmatales bacterium]MDW8387589.1 SpoVG family protein [Gemmatales bacterium]
MEITEIRIKLMDAKESNNERLQAFCSITFDNMFVIRDLKIIEGAKGSFVAMPSRKLTDRCPECGCKNHLRARYCNQCGTRLNEDRAVRDADGRIKLHADIAHPINSACREFVQNAIIKAFHEEQEKAKQPGYVCRYDEIDAGDFDDYEQVINSLDRRGESYRRHSGHDNRSGHRHANSNEPTSERKERSFGAGILD